MIACLSVPYFSAEVERRDQAALLSTPLVIGGRVWEARPVYAFSAEAARRGVRPGMALRQAHLLAPNSYFMEASPLKYAQVSSEILGVAGDFTHLIEPEDLWGPDHNGQQRDTAVGRRLPARYCCDLEELPPADSLPLAQEIGRTVRGQTHICPAIGLASHKFAAQVVAALTRPNFVRFLPPGREAEFLALRSICFLPLDKDTARRFERLGIRTLGQFSALPLAEIGQQFGHDLAAQYHLIRGEAYTPVRPAAPERREQVRYRFDEPISDTISLAAVLGRAGAALAGRLQEAGLEGNSLSLKWETERGASHLQSLTLRRPTADPQQLALVLGELWQQSRLPTEVVELTATASGLARSSVQQLSLFGPARQANQAQQTLRNALAKHGRGCLFRPEIVDGRHPLAECRFRLQELVAL
ncbi:MAG: DNA polymerase Y family protein [Candidatus Promineifilaceae bacterium]